jgi:hypothetical protein
VIYLTATIVYLAFLTEHVNHLDLFISIPISVLLIKRFPNLGKMKTPRFEFKPCPHMPLNLTKNAFNALR